MDTHGAAMAKVETTEPSTALVHTGMSPVVAAVLARNPDAATLREVLALQREWEANEARKAYAVALVNLKRDLPAVIARDKRVNFESARTGQKTNYTHPSLAGAVDAVIEPLTNHGFSHTWHPSIDDKGGVSVTCRLTHAAGHKEEVTLKAPPDKSGTKSDAQAVMSTVTLLQRYTLMAILGLASRDMEEAKGAPEHVEDDVRAPATVEKIDSARNLKCVSWLQSKGIAIDDAEGFVGHKVKDWTTGDLEKLREWGAKQAATTNDNGSDER